MIGTIFKLSKLMPLLYKYWWIFFFLIIVLPTMVQSIDAGIEQENWKIPIKIGALQLTSFEKGLEDAVNGMEFEFDRGDSLEQQIDDGADFIWYLIKNLWKPLFYMVFTFLIIFKTLRWLNDSLKWRALYITIGIMFFLQILVLGVPFKGSWALIKFIIEVARQL